MRVDTYIFNDQAHKINQMHVLFNQESPYITRMSSFNARHTYQKKIIHCSIFNCICLALCLLKIKPKCEEPRTRLSELNLDCQNPSEEYNMLLLCFSTPRLLFLHG